MGRFRNPLLPASVLGTLSHDGELCAAVVLPREAHAERGIGVDLLCLQRVSDTMADLKRMIVTSPGELALMAAFDIPVDPTMILFSLKEAAIKAASFQLEAFIDMREVEVRGPGQPALSILGRPVEAELLGAAVEGFLVTAVKVL
jgi:4'-phosphopantetheinyl transferase EntD